MFSSQSTSGQYKTASGCVIKLEQGDITKFKGDAIVNAANEKMLGGGGVDGAIHAAAGAKLRKLCAQYPDPGGVRCPTGHVRITEGCDLPAKWVLHTVGPVYSSKAESEPMLKLAFASCVTLAQCEEYKIKRIAFPAISCGVYGYPLEDAADVSLRACAEYATTLKEITFVLFGEETMSAFSEAAQRMSEVLKPMTTQSGGDAVQGSYGDAATTDKAADEDMDTGAAQEDGKRGTKVMAAGVTGDEDTREAKAAMMEQATEGAAEVDGEKVQPVLP